MNILMNSLLRFLRHLLWDFSSHVGVFHALHVFAHHYCFVFFCINLNKFGTLSSQHLFTVTFRFLTEWCVYFCWLCMSLSSFLHLICVISCLHLWWLVCFCLAVLFFRFFVVVVSCLTVFFLLCFSCEVMSCCVFLKCFNTFDLCSFFFVCLFCV